MQSAIYHLAASTSPGWYAAAGALGGAIIVGFGNQTIARQQRQAELERLDRQLKHDRELRQAEIQSSADRLSAQLAHDRQIRDLEYLRATCGPVMAGALATPDLIVRLKAAMSSTQGSSKAIKERDMVVHLVNDLTELQARHSREVVTLAGIVGLDAHIVRSLRTVADACGAASSIGREWLLGTRSGVEVNETLEQLDADCGAALVILSLGMNSTDGSTVRLFT